MKNKKLLFSLGALVFAIGCFWSSFTSATSFQLKIEKLNALWVKMAQSIVPIHFADNWNDFWGFIYFSNGGNIAEKDDCNGEWGDKSGDRYDGTCAGSEEPILDEKDYCPYGDKSGDRYDGTCAGSEEPILDEEEDDASGEIYEVKISDEEAIYECKTRVKWFYYNAERWERLWPLDEETWASIEAWYWLTTNGGLYTHCRKAWYQDKYQECEQLASQCDPEDPECENQDAEACTRQVDIDYPNNDWYFGQIKHEYKGQNFGLVIWTNYVRQNPWFGIWENDGELLGTTFIRFENIVPLWFVYDYNGWLWFAWCEIKSTDKKRTIKYLLDERKNGVWNLFEKNFIGWVFNGWIKYKGEGWSSAVDCENIWTAGDSLIKLIIEWLIGMNRESDLWVIWNQSDVKMQYFSSSDINSATLLNYVKERSAILCRWKWLHNPSDINAISNKFLNSDIVCLSFSSKNTISNDISEWTKENWKTLIVKNADVVVDPSGTADDSKNYDIFIEWWDLIINEDAETHKFVFTTQWFIAQGKYINDFIDELKAIYEDENSTESYKWDFSGVWSYIRGNFVVDGHVKGATPNGKLNNKYFIHWKFTTRDSFKDLEETFVWRCSDGYVVNKAWSILDSQWRFCPISVTKKENWETVYEWYNPYEWAALVVIDQNYDSPLYW